MSYVLFSLFDIDQRAINHAMIHTVVVLWWFSMWEQKFVSSVFVIALIFIVAKNNFFKKSIISYFQLD